MKHQLKQAVSSTASGLLKQAIGRRGERASGGIVNPDLVVQVIDDWPAVPWNAAQRMTEKYGLPAEATPEPAHLVRERTMAAIDRLQGRGPVRLSEAPHRRDGALAGRRFASVEPPGRRSVKPSVPPKATVGSAADTHIA
jgi:hypothetical protein